MNQVTYLDYVHNDRAHEKAQPALPSPRGVQYVHKPAAIVYSRREPGWRPDLQNDIRNCLRGDIHVVVIAWYWYLHIVYTYRHWAALNLFSGELRTYLVARGHPDSLSSRAFGRWLAGTTSIRNSTNWERLSVVILANVVCCYFL